MRIPRAAAAALCVLGACIAAGCNSQDTSSLGHDVSRLARDTGRAANNASLVAKVNATLADRKGVGVSGLHITAANGVVTVGGHVRDANEKQIVLSTVGQVRGVKRVVDQLRTLH